MSDETYSPSEPGLSHPLTRCAVTLTDDGRVIMQAGDYAGIIIDEVTGVVTIFGTEIRFASPGISINGSPIKNDVTQTSPLKVKLSEQLSAIDKAGE